jgi:hypothetical protein
LSPLCTEVSVAPAQGPATTADGRTGVSAATVSVRLFQRPAPALPVPGAAAGTALDPQALAGLGFGAPAPAGGVQLVVGAARAEAGSAGASPTAAAAGESAAGGRISAAAAAVDGAPVTAAPVSAGAADGTRPAAVAGATLPRTGGVPFNPALLPLALLGSVGLAAGGRVLLRRA